jgi:hypothetical protein
MSTAPSASSDAEGFFYSPAQTDAPAAAVAPLITISYPRPSPITIRQRARLRQNQSSFFNRGTLSLSNTAVPSFSRKADLQNEAGKVCDASLAKNALRGLFRFIYAENDALLEAGVEDLHATFERGPATVSFLSIVLQRKDFRRCSSIVLPTTCGRSAVASLPCSCRTVFRKYWAWTFIPPRASAGAHGRSCMA